MTDQLVSTPGPPTNSVLRASGKMAQHRSARPVCLGRRRLGPVRRIVNLSYGPLFPAIVQLGDEVCAQALLPYRAVFEFS